MRTLVFVNPISFLHPGAGVGYRPAPQNLHLYRVNTIVQRIQFLLRGNAWFSREYLDTWAIALQSSSRDIAVRNPSFLRRD